MQFVWLSDDSSQCPDDKTIMSEEKKGEVYIYEGPCRGTCHAKDVSIRVVDTEGKFPLIFLTCPLCNGKWCYLKTG